MKDLWTTRCTRCPAALDTLNHFAITSNKLEDDDADADATTSIQCLSICCGDTLDGAREIIETTKLPRWGAIQHYFMAYNDKERCKQLLTFRQVPFYIVFDCNGTLLYAGNQKLDWQTLFKENSNRIDPGTDLPTVDVKVGTQSDSSVHSPTSATTVPMIPQQLLQEEISTFVIDDMDF